MAPKKTTARNPKKTPKRTKISHLKQQQKVQTAEGWKRSMMKIRQSQAAKSKKVKGKK